MSHPDKFLYGTGAFSSEQPRKHTYRKYFNLLDVDGRFARDLDYLFVAQYIVEAKQVMDDGTMFATSICHQMIVQLLHCQCYTHHTV